MNINSYLVINLPDLDEVISVDDDYDEAITVLMNLNPTIGYDWEPEESAIYDDVFYQIVYDYGPKCRAEHIYRSYFYWLHRNRNEEGFNHKPLRPELTAEQFADLVMQGKPSFPK